jgi:hypothetical protein
VRFEIIYEESASMTVIDDSMTSETQTEEFAPSKEVPGLAHDTRMILLPPKHTADRVHTLWHVSTEAEPDVWSVMTYDGLL